MQRVSRDHTFTAFHAGLEPVCAVDAGEWVLVETWDCFGGRTLAGEPRKSIPPGTGNPATGPIYLREATAGDVISVTIADVTPGPRGFVGDRFIDVADGWAYFSETLKLPTNPMVGVLGVVPAEGSEANSRPGPHGGNLDTIDVCAGAQVFLMEQIDGGLVGLGDVHACQGDGEVAGQGIEIPAEVILKLDTEPEPLPTDNPYIIRDSSVIAVASAETFEGAIHASLEDMIRIVSHTMQVDAMDARAIISLRGDVRISQIVNPLMTARVVMPVLW